MKTDPQLKIRLPQDALDWLAAQATLNGSSQASEILRCVRERMEHTKIAADVAKLEAVRGEIRQAMDATGSTGQGAANDSQ